jgi:hypothetical protein
MLALGAESQDDVVVCMAQQLIHTAARSSR